MSDPRAPYDQGRYRGVPPEEQATRALPTTPPEQHPSVMPGEGYVQPAIPPFESVLPEGDQTDPRLRVEAGRFWSGAIATAVVAALIGAIAVVVFESVFSFQLVPPPDLLATGSHTAAFALDGAILALLAAGVLHLLVLAAPRPQVFFGWIMGLVTVVMAALPFAWTSDTITAILSSLVNVVIVIAVWSLMATVASRTVRRR